MPGSNATAVPASLPAWLRKRSMRNGYDPGGARTRDLRIKSPLLYQLSYQVHLVQPEDNGWFNAIVRHSPRGV